MASSKRDFDVYATDDSTIPRQASDVAATTTTTSSPATSNTPSWRLPLRSTFINAWRAACGHATYIGRVVATGFGEHYLGIGSRKHLIFPCPVTNTAKRQAVDATILVPTTPNISSRRSKISARTPITAVPTPTFASPTLLTHDTPPKQFDTHVRQGQIEPHTPRHITTHIFDEPITPPRTWRDTYLASLYHKDEITLFERLDLERRNDTTFIYNDESELVFNKFGIGTKQSTTLRKDFHKLVGASPIPTPKKKSERTTPRNHNRPKKETDGGFTMDIPQSPLSAEEAMEASLHDTFAAAFKEIDEALPYEDDEDDEAWQWYKARKQKREEEREKKRKEYEVEQEKRRAHMRAVEARLAEEARKAKEREEQRRREEEQRTREEEERIRLEKAQREQNEELKRLTEEQQKKEKEAEEAQKAWEEAGKVLRKKIGSFVMPVSDASKTKFYKVLGDGERTIRDNLTVRDLSTLPKGRWLNDEVINSFLTYVVDKANAEAGWIKGKSKDTAPYNLFSSHWYTKAKQGVHNVSRWSRKYKFAEGGLFKAKQIIFPINVGQNHWTLLIIYPPERRIEYLDSFRTGGHEVVGTAIKWLEQELGKLFKKEEWSHVHGMSTKQRNGCDCGVFTCFNAMARIRGFEPQHVIMAEELVETGRMHMASVLLEGGFTAETEWKKA